MWTDFLAFVFGRPVIGKIPERIREAIARQQVQAEILTGWVQLALVVFFWALYTIAPQTTAETSFRPLPWVLGTYLVFTIARLFLALRQIIAPWFLLGSVIIDVSLLLLLIWSFHIQYAQPAAFYLKSSTLIFVFLLIALRALRFEPTYVVAAGLTAAGGWVLLVWYAITEPSNVPLITRDYVVYLTSNHILIGAEVEKILCILLVTAVITVALVRARRLLMRALADETERDELIRFVSPEVVSHIAASERPVEPGDGRVLDATVLFCDIEGFSSISERLSPAQLMQALNAYFAAVAAVAARYCGAIIAYQGDAMLIGFNTAHEDPRHARHALATALGIQREVTSRRFGDDDLVLRTRCGINSGRLIAGAVGTHDRLLFTVYGDEVNIAARLEQLNKTFGTYVLASEQTVTLAGPGFHCRRIDTLTVRGRTRPVTVYVVDPPLPDVDAMD
ncbi:MAG: adenylate/guanylate cyclase domain-containing protein [Rhodospirillales bacterium]|nr:adenylate/guanylate cyclase domain-containing protein [Rhodospirillales bacterium]